ncbi:exodeoxyribonuclease VII large subunit [Fusibacter sp. JL216-2]|uniref:exodeoxyribonuclease VII large subunit n=1 Tax=Fusibacter sp. JL216-2 TaxID=3071453 RepID=UPI003D336560
MKLRPLSVSEVNAYIKRNLSYDPILSNLIIEGELSNYKLHSSGHAYFSLKDSDARISCVMFHRDFSQVDFTPEDGMKIRAKGYISVYERDGKYQLYAKSLEQSGLGDLHVKFEKMKKKLDEEGLFDQKFKKKVPEFPEKIAVVTSPTGAAIRDILNVLKRRVTYTDVTIFPVRVQGETAASEISQMIDHVNAIGNFDTIITGRGGGSIEDLWCFNEEIVARSIFQSDIPVITGIGHETDFTISDFVSDLRAPTPSAAAELSAVSNIELYGYLNAYRSKMVDGLKSKAQVSREMLERYTPDALGRMLVRVSDTKRYELDAFRQRLEQSVNKTIEMKKQSLSYTGQLLDHISPLKTMDRGYSIVLDENDTIVNKVDAISKGDHLKVQVTDGQIHVCVASVSEGESE